MKIEKFKIWLRAIRPFSLSASSIPVILGGSLVLEKNRFSFSYLVL